MSLEDAIAANTAAILEFTKAAQTLTETIKSSDAQRDEVAAKIADKVRDVATSAKPTPAPKATKPKPEPEAAETVSTARAITDTPEDRQEPEEPKVAQEIVQAQIGIAQFLSGAKTESGRKDRRAAVGAMLDKLGSVRKPPLPAGKLTTDLITVEEALRFLNKGLPNLIANFPDEEVEADDDI